MRIEPYTGSSGKQVRERWNLLQRYHERTKVQIEVFYKQLAQMMEWVSSITKAIITSGY